MSASADRAAPADGGVVGVVARKEGDGLHVKVTFDSGKRTAWFLTASCAVNEFPQDMANLEYAQATGDRRLAIAREIAAVERAADVLNAAVAYLRGVAGN